MFLKKFRFAWRKIRNRNSAPALHCIGDSHASFFGGEDRMQPTWPKPSRDRFPCFRSYRLGPVLAYSLQREGSTSKGREKLFEVLSTLPKGASVLLCFGEIDCRAQLTKQAAKQQRPIAEIVSECVAAYTKVADQIAGMGFSPGYWQVPPPTPVGSTGGEFPVIGSYEERLEITRLFNSELAATAGARGHTWISIFESLTDPEGKPHNHFFLDGVHLSQQAMRLAGEAARTAYPGMDFSTPTRPLNYGPAPSRHCHRDNMIPARKLNKIRRANRMAALFPALNDFSERLKLLKYAKRWQKGGWALPLPDLMKRAILKQAAEDAGARIFIETGTFRGDTPWYFRNAFSKIFSIEVQPQLAELASERFKDLSHIRIVEGDSAKKLAEIVQEIDAPVLFWLDGHYSAGITGRGENDCPIWDEMNAIIGKVPHPFSIFIDDARSFNGSGGYPTLDELRDFVESGLPGHGMTVENDLIRITPCL